MSNFWVSVVRVIFSLGLNGKEALIWCVSVHQTYFWLECRQTSSSVSSVSSVCVCVCPHTHTHTHQCWNPCISTLTLGEVWQNAHTHTNTEISSVTLSLWQLGLGNYHCGEVWACLCVRVPLHTYILVCVHKRVLICLCVCACVMSGLSFVNAHWHLTSQWELFSFHQILPQLLQESFEVYEEYSDENLQDLQFFLNRFWGY